MNLLFHRIIHFFVVVAAAMIITFFLQVRQFSCFAYLLLKTNFHTFLQKRTPKIFQTRALFHSKKRQKTLTRKTRRFFSLLCYVCVTLNGIIRIAFQKPTYPKILRGGFPFLSDTIYAEWKPLLIVLIHTSSLMVNFRFLFRNPRSTSLLLDASFFLFYFWSALFEFEKSRATLGFVLKNCRGYAKIIFLNSPRVIFIAGLWKLAQRRCFESF